MPIRPANDTTIAEAGARLRAGELVAFPTETVYGLGADATNGQAVARIFEAKGRPRFNPLIVHVADMEEARALGHFNEIATSLAARFWPGALTLVVERRRPSPIADLAVAGLETIALRVPANDIARRVIAASERPIAAPSANPSGRLSPTTAQAVAAELGERVALILDGGAAALGIESTIVHVAKERATLLRPGAIARAEIATLLGGPLADPRKRADAQPEAPGRLKSHYAPRLPLRLGARHVEAGEALLAFGPDVPPHDGPTINLSPEGDLREAAARFFSTLRELDQSGAERIAVMPIPDDGLGEALNDRLQRAAAPRGMDAESAQ